MTGTPPLSSTGIIRMLCMECSVVPTVTLSQYWWEIFITKCFSFESHFDMLGESLLFYLREPVILEQGPIEQPCFKMMSMPVHGLNLHV